MSSETAGNFAAPRRLVLQESVYDLDTVKKAAYKFIDRVAADLAISGTDIVCTLTFSRGISESGAETLVQEFRAELLDQDLRRKVAAETANLRNAILALAFAPIKPTERE